eukprot:gene11437-11231_t
MQGQTIVTVAPITHSRPSEAEAADAFELPAAAKARLGLDDQRSWAIASDLNRFVWPGVDLRPVRRGGEDVAFGFLPRGMVEALRARILTLARNLINVERRFPRLSIPGSVNSSPERVRPLSIPPPDLRLEAVLESISDAFYAVSPEWTYVIFNGAAEQYFGVTRDQVLGKNMWEVFPQGIGTPFETVCKRAMEGRKGVAFESPSRWRPDRWVEIRITPMIDGGIGVSLHDITERRKAEQARELLAREVDHRSRNALAVVQAIVRLTEGPDLESYKEAVFGRVNALARAQGALADRRWEGAPLQELVDEAMAALSTPDRYSLTGPAVRMSPEQTQPVSMLIHELATNASKYGGLSTPQGRVAIAWTVGEDKAIDLTWRESAG